VWIIFRNKVLHVQQNGDDTWDDEQPSQSKSLHGSETSDHESLGEVEESDHFLKLDLTEDKIVFVDDRKTFEKFLVEINPQVSF